MADKKKKKKKANSAPNKDDKVTKSALKRGMESQKKRRVADVKSKPKNPQPQQQQEKKGGLKEYFSGVKTEVKKVVWPTRKELVSYTIVVGIACAFFGLFLWGVDSGFLAIIREVFSISMN